MSLVEINQTSTKYLYYVDNVTPLITSFTQLRNSGRDIEFPFAIEILPGRWLTCFQSLRLLPGNRLTALAEWQGKKVIAKLFFNPKREKMHFMRDATGCLAMQTNAVKTAKLLYAGNALIDNVSVIVLEYLENALPLSRVWPTLKLNEKELILKQIAKILVILHQSGFSHEDLHFANFLIQAQQVFMIDGDAVKANKQFKPLSFSLCLNNLTQFCCQLPAIDLPLSHYLYGEYCALKNSHSHCVTRSKKFQNTLTKMLCQKQNKLSKKAFRECTPFAVTQNWNKRTIINRQANSLKLQALLNDLEKPFQTEEKLKAGNTCTLIRHSCEEENYVIKRYNIKSFWHRIKRCFRPSRASHSWKNAFILQQLSIPTPTAVALIENRFGWLRGTAYYIYHYAEGILLNDFFEKNVLFDVKIAEDVVKLLQSLHDSRLCHRDLKANNILLSNNKPLLIDLDSMKTYKNSYLFKRAWQRDMQRFLRNWQEKTSVYAIFYELLQERGLLQ